MVMNKTHRGIGAAAYKQATQDPQGGSVRQGTWEQNPSGRACASDGRTTPRTPQCACTGKYHPIVCCYLVGLPLFIVCVCELALAYVAIAASYRAKRMCNGNLQYITRQGHPHQCPLNNSARALRLDSAKQRPSPKVWGTCSPIGGSNGWMVEHPTPLQKEGVSDGVRFL